MTTTVITRGVFTRGVITIACHHLISWRGITIGVIVTMNITTTMTIITTVKITSVKIITVTITTVVTVIAKIVIVRTLMIPMIEEEEGSLMNVAVWAIEAGACDQEVVPKV